MLFQFFYTMFPDVASLLVSITNDLWTLAEMVFPSWEEPLNVFYELFMQ